MRIDALALRLRPRTPLEAADLGVRLCQDHNSDGRYQKVFYFRHPSSALFVFLTSYESDARLHVHPSNAIPRH
jgi:hypothetical protein